jgi:fatty-acyl-CoA synthase
VSAHSCPSGIIDGLDEENRMTTATMTPTWHAERRPDAPAIVMGTSGETVTYAQLEDRSTRFARALRARGIGPGDHVAVLMENNRPYLEVTWAAQRSGLYYTAINRHLRAHEVQYVLDDCGAVALVSSEAMADVVAELDVARLRVRISAVGALPGFERYDDVVAGEVPGPLDDEREGQEMLYSSGTTGLP